MKAGQGAVDAPTKSAKFVCINCDGCDKWCHENNIKMKNATYLIRGQKRSLGVYTWGLYAHMSAAITMPTM